MKALLVELTRGRPRWRSRVALAVVASAAVAVVAVALRDDCEAASLEFAPDRIASSFAATGLAAGPPQADRVAAKLERYVSAWSDARRTACGSHSAALTCLDHAATEFRTVVTDFERADAGTVGAAWFAVAGLPAPEACLDEAEPEDPPSAAELAVQRRLAQARAKQRTGRVDEALAESEVALRDAADLPARTRLEACFRLGRVFAAADQPRQSAETLSTCFFDAREADHAALAAASATHVANAAIALHDPAEAEVWLRHAEADLQRAGDPPGYRAPWLITTGNHAALQARHADAVAAFTEALALIGDDPLRASAVLSNRGDVYRSLGRLEESEADLRRALEMKATELPPGDPQLFAVTTNLALTLQARGDFAGAQVMLESAYEMATEASGPGSSRATRALVNLGNLAFERDDFLAAADYNERALRGRQAKEGDGSLAVPMLNLANALLALERREEAIVHYREVLQIFGHTLGADHPNNAYALTGLGAALTELGRADEAVDVLRRAVEIREQTHASLDHLTESRDFLDKALESAKRE